MELAELLESIKPEELRFIAERDYGQDCSRHLEALRQVVADGGRLPADGNWYPYEVIELGANALEPGHEREFAICTLLVIEAVTSGRDRMTDLDAKFRDHAANYDKLPPELRETVLCAFAAAGL